MMERKKTYSLLYVDLDGTFLKTDILWEQLIILLRCPIKFMGALISLIKGKAAFKAYCLTNAGIPDISILPIHDEVLRIINDYHKQGVQIILATASMHEIAVEVKRIYPMIDDCIGSTSQINMKGEVKARAIVEHSLGREFAYIGNDHADIPIWNQAHEVIYVGDSPAITSHIMRSYSTATIIDPGKKSGLIEYINEIRMYQWVKNTLVFIPALLAHVMNFEIFTSLTLTFFVFGLLASSVYVMNDLLDLHSDRMHPRKKHRPIASGQIAIPNGISLYILLLITSILSALIFLPVNVIIVLGVYLAMTSYYSMYGKKIAILDVMLLAGLYTLRLIAGAQAANVILSEWLMGFSMFFFLSLAFVKRYSELIARNDELDQLPGRGYGTKDSIMLLTAGLSSSMLSIMVLALYINSDAVRKLYQYPEYIWLICPAILTWLLQMWLIAHRGRMNDDPIISMAKTPMTYIVLTIISITIWFAT
jgi:4-hydroxybenzoate polyprenyltransferase